MKSDWYAYIDDYLDDRLPAEKQEGMEVAIVKDPALAREVQLHRMERQALQILKDDKARAEFQRWTEGLASEAPASVLKFTWSRVRWYALSAASVVFVLVCAWMFFPRGKADSGIVEKPSTEQTPILQPKPPVEQIEQLKTSVPLEQVIKTKKKKKPNPPLQSEKKPPIPNGNSDVAVLDVNIRSLYEEPTSVLSRGGSSTNQSEKALAEGKKAFEKKDYRLTIQLLGKVPSDSTRIYPEAVFVIAHAHFQLKEYEKAATVFQIAMTLDFDQKKNAKYMAAVSLFAAGAKDNRKLKRLLEELDGKVSSEKQRGVRQMLDKLK